MSVLMGISVSLQKPQKTNSSLGLPIFADAKLGKVKKEVALQDSKHRKTLSELGKGVDALSESFNRLDSQISRVGQTATKIGDHLQSADSLRETVGQSTELIRYLMESNSSPGDLMELSPLSSDDSRVAEAAALHKNSVPLLKKCGY